MPILTPASGSSGSGSVSFAQLDGNQPDGKWASSLNWKKTKARTIPYEQEEQNEPELDGDENEISDENEADEEETDVCAASLLQKKRFLKKT